MDETKYGFGITIKLSNEAFINHKENFIEIHISDNIRLKISSQKPPSGLININFNSRSTSNQLPLDQSNLLTVSSEGYISEEYARVMGYKIIQALKLIAVKKRFGIIADKKQRIPIGSSGGVKLKLFENIYKDFPDMYFVDGSNFSLYVYPLNKELNRVSSGQMRIKSISYNAKYLEEDFKAMYPLSDIQLTPIENLAIDLYLTSKFEISVEAKFIFLINVVECLKKEEKQDKVIIQYIDSLYKDVKEKFPENESLQGRVNELKKHSIRQSCKKLVKNNLDDKACELFDKCYKIRSKLVHKGKVSEPNTPGNYLNKLDEIVSTLILSIIQAKKKPL